MQAVDQSSLGKVVNEREVQIIAYPTIKIPANNELVFKELEAVLNQVQVLPFTCRSNTVSAEGWTLRPSISLSMTTTATS